jgi:tRNA(fMet)-specific endonuclease VapC
LEDLEDSKEVCVDTDILIDFLKKKTPGSLAYKKWKHKGLVAITSVSAFELLQGAREADYGKERYEEAMNLIEQQDEVIPFDKNAADVASQIASDLRRDGKEIEIRDLFIASICLARKVPLLTRNKDHYERIRSLKLLKV